MLLNFCRCNTRLYILKLQLLFFVFSSQLSQLLLLYFFSLYTFYLQILSSSQLFSFYSFSHSRLLQLLFLYCFYPCTASLSLQILSSSQLLSIYSFYKFSFSNAFPFLQPLYLYRSYLHHFSFLHSLFYQVFLI